MFNLSANVLYMWGRFEEALNNYNNLLNYCLLSKNLFYYVSVLNEIITIYYRQSRYKEVIETYEKSIDILRQIEDKDRISDVLPNLVNNVAATYAEIEDYDQAISLYDESLNKERSRRQIWNIDYIKQYGNNI